MKYRGINMNYSIIIFTLFICYLILQAIFCSVNQKQANKVLQSMGYTNIQFGEDSFFGCDQEYAIGKKFTANSLITREKVSGVICSGLLKDITVRFN